MTTDVAGAFAGRLDRRGPSHVVAAPGRVNLVGDHIDYVGLSVLPMAIGRRVTVAFRPRPDSTVRVGSLQEAFRDRTFDVAARIEPFAPGDWGNYVKAAVQGLTSRVGAARGFDALVASDLPVAAGLSSSSALVVASALAFLTSNGVDVPIVELAELLAEAERFVGTRGGGMDQAICLGAEAGTASRIDFAPLRLTPVPVPAHWRIVVASSLVEASKSAGAREVYNRRTAECREALDHVLDQLGAAETIRSYPALLERTPPGKLLNATTHLPAPLRPRFGHVVSEAVRVGEAEGALRRGDAARLGQIMLASHASLRDDYAVSCPELDRIVEIAAGAGAYGARLTGAGFGGCAIALTDADGAEGIVAALRDRFYGPRGADRARDAHVFVARPERGAWVERVSSE